MTSRWLEFPAAGSRSKQSGQLEERVDERSTANAPEPFESEIPDPRVIPPREASVARLRSFLDVIKDVQERLSESIGADGG